MNGRRMEDHGSSLSWYFWWFKINKLIKTHLQWWDVWVGDVAVHIFNLRQVPLRYMHQLWRSHLASKTGVTVFRWRLVILIMILRKRKRMKREDKGRGERGEREVNQNDAETSESLNTPRGMYVYETVWANIASALWLDGGNIWVR